MPRFELLEETGAAWRADFISASATEDSEERRWDERLDLLTEEKDLTLGFPSMPA